MDIKVTLNPNPKAKPTDSSALGFGKIFTDHMFRWSWNSDEGWHNPRIVPFERLSIHPARNTCQTFTDKDHVFPPASFLRYDSL